MICLLIAYGLLGQIDASLRASAMTIKELANPVLCSEEEIDAHADLCRRLLAQSPPQGDPSLSSPGLLLKQSLARLFMTFARPGRGGAGVEPGQLQLVDLGTHNDPALQLLRERVRLPAPRGYVFVRTFSSRHAMPSDILVAFQRENTRGVTILGRYIAMLAPQPTHSSEESLYQRMHRRVLSHELVHAFIGSSVEWQRSRSDPAQRVALRNRLPVWFHEGCATYLSDSPGGACVTELVETPAGYRHLTLKSRAPADYQAYKLAFDYAASRLGRRGLFDILRQTIEAGDSHIMLTRLQAVSFEQLLERARDWKSRRLTLLYSLAIALLAGVALYVWRLLPSSRSIQSDSDWVSESEEL